MNRPGMCPSGSLKQETGSKQVTVHGVLVQTAIPAKGKILSDSMIY